MPAGDTTITGVHHDSRRVTPGGIFVCVSGLHRDGHEFASRAREAGAAVVVGEREAVPNVHPYLQVDDSRKALGLLAAAWHGHPSRQLTVVGVTGTNGKSSVTWMVESVCRAAGRDAAVMGTLGVGRTGALRPQPFTTPEATEFQGELAALRDAGVEVVAVEVSSHGLELRRTYGTRFPIVVFTNLSQDHLDFHQDMTKYAAAKNRLFREDERGGGGPSVAVVNADDPHLAAILRGSRDRLLRYG
ncbi:MAG: UDP-N-acetylmuramoyl-L-alanyl-D-glutamate--2,6-diaminopimelate ligase, partial [Candidatus Eisenbacteria bacterium]|nr:UDP-N-acetylmuramoyl-L-alanyl-D-glutamate--2,6-diaminopimelate ligase [Candidatus Eisenbacteria bacterium]